MCVLSSTAMVMPQPMIPAVDPSQLAAQQQAFINQQAMLMVSGWAPGAGEEPHIGVCALEGEPSSPPLWACSVSLCAYMLG